MKNLTDICQLCKDNKTKVIDFFAIKITNRISKWAVIGICKGKASIKETSKGDILVIETHDNKKKTVKIGDWIYVIHQGDRTQVFIPDDFFMSRWLLNSPSFKDWKNGIHDPI